MCKDCALFSPDFLNLYAADAALIDTGATRTSVSMDNPSTLRSPDASGENRNWEHPARCECLQC